MRKSQVHPDGKHIIFRDTDAQNLKMVNTVSGVVTTISPISGGTVISPSLSPDGTKICFEYRSPNELHILNLDQSLFSDGVVTPVASDTPAPLPLLANYPNPFNPQTTISFTLPESGNAELAIYNLAGQKIRTLISGETMAGAHEVLWDGRDDRGVPVSSGIYISRLRAGEQVISSRMMLVK